MDTDDASGNVVVQFASDQRTAAADEPACVICGRFGEYICDATDDDVCSLECRDICTANCNMRQEQSVLHQAGAALGPAESTTGDERKRSLDCEETARLEEAAAAAAGMEVEARKRLQICVERAGAAAAATPLLPLPLWRSFDPVPDQLKLNMVAKGFEHPTPVQMQTIPAVLVGGHVLVSAPTGTGKTAAFLVPLLMLVVASRFEMEQSIALGLVLAPLRELAIQIEDEAKALIKGIAKMKTALVVGGLPLPPQLHRLRQGVQLIVATPGRLLEILVHQAEDGALEHLLDSLRVCVVDEVDMMLSVGFRDDIMQILGVLLASGSTVQLVFTSATISKQVEDTVARSLGPTLSYLRIRIGDSPTSVGLTINHSVDHSIRWLEENGKKAELFRFLASRRHAQTLVFVDSKAGADMLALAIHKKHRQIKANSFHAGKSQDERLQVLEDFVDEKTQVLVSTNALGRGIDLLTVDSVVIFDAPRAINDYVHLVGRVLRGVDTGLDVAPTKGSSIMYVNARDATLFADLVALLQPHHVRIPEEVYSVLRARSAIHERQSAVPSVMTDAKRAYRVIQELQPSTVSDRARSWGVWKHTTKRLRNV